MAGPAGGGGPPPGVNSAQIAAMQQGAQAAAQGGATGLHEFVFGRLGHGQGFGWNLNHMGYFANLNPGSPFSIQSRMSLLGLKARKAKLLDYSSINPPSLPIPSMGQGGPQLA